MAATRRPADAMCSRCGQALDELDLLLVPVDAGGTRRCPACLDEAGEPTGRDAGQRAHHDLPDGAAALGVRELRNQVAAVIRRAAAGERIIVTVDGRPMAQLGPITPSGRPSLADLAAAGLVESPRTAAPATPPAGEDLPVDVRLDRVLEELRGR